MVWGITILTAINSPPRKFCKRNPTIRDITSQQYHRNFGTILFLGIFRYVDYTYK
jgi:hypothetical protein